MCKRKFIVKILSLFLVLLVPVCFSDWTYLTKTSTVETLNDDEVTLTVHTRQQSKNITVSSPTESSKVQDNDKATRTMSETTTLTGYSHKEGEWLRDAQLIGLVSTFNNDKTIETIVSQFQQEKVIKRDRKTVNAWKDQYKFTYTIAWFKWTSTVTKTRQAPVDFASDCKLKVRRNKTISPWDLPIDDYQQYSYFSDSGYTTFFDFKKPITNSTDIYLKYYDAASSLTQFINGKTSGIYSIYNSERQGSKGNFDVASDFAYETLEGSDSLNQSIIASGTTFNFTYFENQLFPSPNSGGIADGDDADNTHRDTHANVALDYYNGQYVGNYNCSVRVRLNGDLTVRGTLNLGAQVGGNSSNSQFSEIIGQYSQIDLNGHNLIIDGGTVNCYGSIVDRTGGARF